MRWTMLLFISYERTLPLDSFDHVASTWISVSNGLNYRGLHDIMVVTEGSTSPRGVNMQRR